MNGFSLCFPGWRVGGKGLRGTWPPHKSCSLDAAIDMGSQCRALRECLVFLIPLHTVLRAGAGPALSELWFAQRLEQWGPGWGLRGAATTQITSSNNSKLQIFMRRYVV